MALTDVAIRALKPREIRYYVAGADAGQLTSPSSAFGVVMFTFFGVTYLLPGLHAYA